MTEWDSVNLPLEKLYGVQTGYVDNAKKVQFDSGRDIAYQRNTRNRRRYNVSYAASPAQESFFFNWYENDLGGNAGTFTAPSLRGDGSVQAYKMEGTPTSEGAHAIRSINMIWVEA